MTSRFEVVRQDVRYALRLLRRAPGFTTTALATLGLAIGLTTAMFSVVYAVLVRPLPYPGADRLLRVWEEHPGATTGSGAMTGNRWLTNRTLYAWADHASTIDAVGAYGSHEYTVTIRDVPSRIVACEVSPAVLDVLGATPIAGRMFTREEGERESAPIVLLSEPLWRDRFGGDRRAIGTTITIDGEAYAIVGVLPARFHFPDVRVQLWVPDVVPRVSTDPAQKGRTTVFTALARLRPGATIAQAEAEATSAARSVPRPPSSYLFFGRGGEVVVHARPLAADMAADTRPALLVLAAAVTLLLLVGCANVANLFLSHGVARQRELAVRAAIGATTGRLAWQLLAESAVLSAAGGTLGVLVGWTLIRMMPLLAPARFPRIDGVRMDARALAVAAGASVFTALAAGLAPAWRGARLHLSESLHGGDGAAAGGFRGAQAQRLRDALLVLEAALAVILLVGAALLAHSFVRLMNVEAGYTADRVVTAHVQMEAGATPEQSAQLVDSVLERLRTMPGIVAAGAGNMMPFFNRTAISSFTIPARSSAEEPVVTRALNYVVTPGYAEALRLRLRAGRLFNRQDTGAGVRPMIVNEEFVRQFLRDGPVIGRRFENIYNERGGTEIVGVVGNVLKGGNDTRPQPEIYFVASKGGQRFQGFFNLVIRSSSDPAALASTIRATIQQADPAALVDQVDTLSHQVAASVAQPRFATTVLALFAATAVALAGVGLYGVLSYAVSRRRRELGVRAALGATRGNLLALVVSHGLLVTGVGSAIGLAAAAAGSQLIRSALFGIVPLDPVSFATAPAVLLVAATMACLVPAYRAARTNPAEALRE